LSTVGAARNLLPVADQDVVCPGDGVWPTDAIRHFMRSDECPPIGTYGAAAPVPFRTARTG
jgi:hypothetical protein